MGEAAVTEAKEPRSRLVIAAGAATAISIPGAVALYQAIHKYAEDAEFRRWMRRDAAVGAQYIEQLMTDYFPKLVTIVRIAEDAQHGDGRWVSPVPAPGPGSAPLHELNLGGAPLPQPLLGNNGTHLYRKLNEPPKDELPAEIAVEPALAPEPKEAVAANAIGAAVGSGIGAALGGIKFDGSTPTLGGGAATGAIGEVVADDPRGEDPVSVLRSRRRRARPH